MLNSVYSLLFVFIGFLFGSPVNSSEGKVIIEVVNLKNDKGNVKLSLYKSEDGFPDKSDKAAMLLVEKIQNGKSIVELTGVPSGEYAIAMLHDENDNNKMDFTFYGKPKEGFGFSNNPKLRIGPPKYEKAKFKHSSGESRIQIKAKYY